MQFSNFVDTFSMNYDNVIVSKNKLKPIVFGCTIFLTSSFIFHNFFEKMFYIFYLQNTRLICRIFLDNKRLLTNKFIFIFSLTFE